LGQAVSTGERFRYNTGATVAGILIERVAGAPFAEVLSKRVFEQELPRIRGAG
jgi:CubicO group peptidase (beta-lactamase class C family)